MPTCALEDVLQPSLRYQRGVTVQIMGRASRETSMERDQLEMVLATLHELLEAHNAHRAAELVRSAQARVEQTGHDGWNGGTGYWDLVLSVDPVEFARLGRDRESLQVEIGRHLESVVQQFNRDTFEVRIAPRIVVPPEWRASGGRIPEEVRRDIFDGLVVDEVFWAGRLNEVEFLQRLYNLKTLPSTDPRYKDAEGDIWQHCINNDDWGRDWVYSDPRFELLTGTEDTFLRFLCEMVHPVVRPDSDEASRLVAGFNSQLRSVGWEIAEEHRIGSRHRYAHRRLGNSGARAVARGRTAVDALDAASMEKVIERMEHAIERDPALAIGSAKEFVESCCKTILNRRAVEYSKKADLGDLAKLVAKELQLVPEGISEAAKGADNIRRVLGNLASLTHNLAELRGLYGTGHGREGKHRGLGPRHARLAVAAAIAFVDFVVDTFHQREAGGQPQSGTVRSSQ